MYREIDPHELKLGTLLGEGGFAKGAFGFQYVSNLNFLHSHPVYLGDWRGVQVAVKIFDQVELNQVDDATLDSLRREV